MSTHAIIAMKTDIGYRTIYLHNSGMPMIAGRKLLTAYNDAQKVNDLINLGDLSTLGYKLNPTNSKHSFKTPEHNVTIAYHRDNGESLNINEIVIPDGTKEEDILDILRQEEYLYVFKDNKWFYAEEKRPYRLQSLDTCQEILSIMHTQEEKQNQINSLLLPYGVMLEFGCSELKKYTPMLREIEKTNFLQKSTNIALTVVDNKIRFWLKQIYASYENEQEFLDKYAYLNDLVKTLKSCNDINIEIPIYKKG